MDGNAGIGQTSSELVSDTSSRDFMQMPNPDTEGNSPGYVDTEDLDEPIGESDRDNDEVSDAQVESGGVATLSEPAEVPSKLLHLPTSRIKSIIKTVPAVHLVNSEAVALIGKSTEFFLNELAREAHQMIVESGKKTLSMVHIEGVIQTLPQFEFLDGMLV
ncbi:DNA polymerase epsilon subunit 4 [Echinococcus granulosus]|uniref:DNA polymerase epsilon subunit n=1 Tax=Echinococcus granulosus TaxID=6210 RepID=U6IUL5_ECHGR|nr:DNA polymerase epsilon subunit [Echinococcus granulosus]EUB65043.1 DNA polymerase epsilon subunit [Echinococcus granulosus]KAH9287240.1 DNA polymerase epsilon subunit 4 [Echinococcus granulosus]CDS15396.1 DNA polymerase epsilon subunit 4 [Echinococcus granulosus]